MQLVIFEQYLMTCLQCLNIAISRAGIRSSSKKNKLDYILLFDHFTIFCHLIILLYFAILSFNFIFVFYHFTIFCHQLPTSGHIWLNQLTLEFAEVARQGHVVVVCGPVDEQVEPGAVLAQQQED